MLGIVYAHLTCLHISRYTPGTLLRSVEEIVESTRTFLLLPANRVKLSSSVFLQILELAAVSDMRCILLRGKAGSLARTMTPYARARFLAICIVVATIRRIG